jgi:hypothetical protein
MVPGDILSDHWHWLSTLHLNAFEYCTWKSYEQNHILKNLHDPKKLYRRS